MKSTLVIERHHDLQGQKTFIGNNSLSEVVDLGIETSVALYDVVVCTVGTVTGKYSETRI